jgi:hypothetical protein
MGYDVSLLLYFLILQIIFIIIIKLISIIKYIPIDNKFTIYTNPLGTILQKIQKINICIFLGVYFSIVVITYVIISIDIDIPAIPGSMYDNVMDNVIMVISGLGIFNLGALLALLQLNYNRFNSSLLVKNLLKSPRLIITTIFPFVIILFNFLLLDKNNCHVFLPITLIILSIISSVLLMMSFNKTSEINVMLVKLLLKTDEEDFDMYKKNIIYRFESRIDTILSLALRIIKKEDVANAHSFFHNLSFWINKNIGYINYNTSYYQDRMMNRFNDFFDAIVHALVKTKSNTLHNYFINSIHQLVLSNINSQNFKSYEIIYETLFKYLTLSLEKKKNNLAYDIYNIIYRNASTILLNMPRLELKNDMPLLYDRRLKDFKDIFIDYIEKIVEKAIDRNCIFFLSKIRIYDNLFNEFGNEKIYEKWDGKVVSIFTKTRQLIIDKNNFLVEHNKSVHSCNNDYEIFMPYYSFSETKRNYQYYEILMKFVLDSLCVLNFKSIEKGKVKSDVDFELIYGQFIPCVVNNDFDNFKIFYSLYERILDLFFERQFKSDVPDINLIYSLWSHIIQIKEYDEDGYAKEELFENEINDKYNKLMSKYPRLKEIENMKPSFRKVTDFDLKNPFDIS